MIGIVARWREARVDLGAPCPRCGREAQFLTVRHLFFGDRARVEHAGCGGLLGFAVQHGCWILVDRAAVHPDVGQPR